MTSTADLVTESVGDLSVKKKENFKQKFCFYIRDVITVEPVIGAYIMASFLCSLPINNLELEKSCRSNLEMNDTVCEAILNRQHENYTEANNQIQILISNVHSWQLPLQTVMPLIMVLFLGSFSDRHKWRKPFLLMPLVGEIISVVGCILCVFFMRSWSLEVQGIFQLIIPSFFGSQPMLTMAVFAYIADVSTLEMRTLRIGVVQIVLNTFVPIAQFFSAPMFELTGYYGVFLTAGALYTFGFLYGLYWIKEPREPVASSTASELLRDMFDHKHAIDTVNLVLKKSPGNNRLYIILMLAIVLIYNAVVVGEEGLFFYYIQIVFKWTNLEFGYFRTVNFLIHLAGTILGISLFTKIFHITDLMILLLTFLDRMISNVIVGFANTNVLLYLASAVSLTIGITPIAIRSLETKLVSENDLGKAQSLFGICEAIAPAIATPIYNKGIYNNTLTTFPSAYFFFGILLYAVCSFFITWMYLKEKRKEKFKSDNELEIVEQQNATVKSSHETTNI